MVEIKGEEYGIKSIPVNNATYRGSPHYADFRKNCVTGNSRHKWEGCNLLK